MKFNKLLFNYEEFSNAVSLLHAKQHSTKIVQIEKNSIKPETIKDNGNIRLLKTFRRIINNAQEYKKMGQLTFKRQLHLILKKMFAKKFLPNLKINKI